MWIHWTLKVENVHESKYFLLVKIAENKNFTADWENWLVYNKNDSEMFPKISGSKANYVYINASLNL